MKNRSNRLLAAVLIMLLIAGLLFGTSVFAHGSEGSGRGLGGFHMHGGGSGGPGGSDHGDDGHGEDSHSDDHHEGEEAEPDDGSSATVDASTSASEEPDENEDSNGGSTGGAAGHWGGGSSHNDHGGNAGTDSHGKPIGHDPGEEEDPPDPFDPTIPESENLDEGKFVTLTINVHKLGTDASAEICVYKVEDGAVVYKKTKEVTGVVDDDKEPLVIAFTVEVPVGHECFVAGSPVPGYITPEVERISLGNFKGDFEFEGPIKLVYEKSAAWIYAESVSIVNKPTRDLMIGEEWLLQAVIAPLNASATELTWETDSDAVSIDQNGKVTALKAGEAEVTVTLTNNGLDVHDSCTIHVVEIAQVDEPDIGIGEPIPLGVRIPLPDTVIARDTEGGAHEVPVEWEGEFVQNLDNGQYLYVTGCCECEDSEGNPQYGPGEECPDCDECMVQLTGKPEIPGYHDIFVDLQAQEGSLKKITWNLAEIPASLVVQVDVDYVLEVEVNEPAPDDNFENTDWDGAYWVSSNPLDLFAETPVPGVVTYNPGVDPDRAVLSVVLKGLQAGKFVMLYMKDSGNALVKTIAVSVTSNPADLVDDAYILPTNERFGETVTEQFETFDDVFITGKAVPEGKYYFEIIEKGDSDSLGDGNLEISVTAGSVKIFAGLPATDDMGKVISGFKLSEVIPDFNGVTTYSKEVFVKMSKDKDFPEGDDDESGLPLTFKTNFKIGSPVPTGSINVRLTQPDGTPLPDKFLGKHVILAREEYGDIPLADVGIEVFYKEGKDPDDFAEWDLTVPTDGSKLVVPYGDLYVDEVKLFGFIYEKDNGETWVYWTQPRETLKIGGYLLLMDDLGQWTTLEQVTDEGMGKQVHIMRDDDKTVIIEVYP